VLGEGDGDSFVCVGLFSGDEEGGWEDGHFEDC